MSVTKGVLHNGAAIVIQRIVRVLDQLLLIPFFLTSWGAAYYGEWLTLTIIPSVLAFSDLGFGSAVSNSFVLAYASGDKQKAADFNKSGIYAISLSICIGIALTIGVLLAGNHFHLFEKSLIPAGEAMTAVTLLMTAKLLSFYNQLGEGYFRGARKAAFGGFMGAGYSIANLTVGICVLFAGYGVVGYAISQFIVSVIFTIVYLFIGRKLIDLKGHKGAVRLTDLKMITSKGMGYMMMPVWQSIYFQGGTFVVRIALGPECVAVFNTVRTICRSVNQLFSIISSSISPDLQYEYGQRNLQTVHRLFRIAVTFSMLTGLLGTAFLTLFGLDIYELWTRSILTVPAGMWIAFIIGILFNAVWWTSSVAYRIANQPGHFAIASTATACLSVGISYLLSIQLGLTGAALGAVFFDAAMMLYVLPDSCRLLNMRVKDLFTHLRDDCSFIKKKFISRA